jgi:hypothetical protein
LSEKICEDLGLVQQSVITLQNQLDSLAAVVVQNHRGLDLISVEKGGICMFLGEECCFYANQSRTVRENARQLLERIKAREAFWNRGWKSWAPWEAPMVGPLTVLLMLSLLGPCVINLLTRFICNRMNAVRLQLVRQYQRLPLDDSCEMVIRDYEE